MTVVLKAAAPFWRGALLMWVLYLVHRAQPGIPGLGYWTCTLAAFTLGSIAGATGRRLTITDRFELRKRRRDAGEYDK